MNFNTKTGQSFGYISANSLNSELVDELLYGSQANDLSYQAAFEEADIDSEADNYDELVEEFNDNYEQDEPTIEGIYEGVSYGSSWLGGALNFFVFESPHVTMKAAICSPCVPGAGDLNNEGDYQCYDVPAEWREI